ncbi:MAG TPA: WcaF family extracellular polysaccharide biosynthesis acetyltransferase [Terracidiphilus sp.]|nr:WcaF family extracellular polysaccharide biosynthesis acetyltransferase [Terracidiphilus sp.]
MAEARQYQDLSRFRMPKDFRGRSPLTVQVWWILQDTLFRMSPQVCYGWRNFLLRLFGARIGKRVQIRSTARVTYPWKLTIGDYVWVGDDCVFYSLGEIVLGSHVAIAHDVYFCTGLHDYTKIDFPIGQKPICIEDEVWIPNDVFIGPGVTIGKGSIVGARSTVLDSLPPGMVCFGSPARPVRPREVSR